MNEIPTPETNVAREHVPDLIAKSEDLERRLTTVTAQRDAAWATIAAIKKDFVNDGSFGKVVETLFADPLEQAEKERDELAAWKESAMSVSAEMDIQEVGRLLGVKLGHPIYPAIESGIRELKQKLTIARAALENIADHNEYLTVNIAEQALKQTAPKP